MKEIIKRKKRISLFVLKIFLIMFFAFMALKPMIAYAYTPNLDSIKLRGEIQTTKLSELSADESVEFIVENGVEIPDYLIESPNLGEFVKWVIQSVENNPDYQFLYSYDETLSFVESIKELVNTTVQTSQSNPFSTYSVYTLQDNTQYGPWNDDFSNYNCYIYSIGRTDVFKNPGYFSGGSFSINMSIYEMAMLVKEDLEILGMGGVYVSNVRPDILYSNETLIAIRKTTATGLFVTKDYHLMKFHPDEGFWTHKPGGTAILKYNHQPEDKEWIQEGIIDGAGTAATGNLVYDSEIYYIIYNWSGLTIQDSEIIAFSPQIGFNGHISIPDGVIAIGNSAFAEHPEISQISIPDSAEYIDKFAFYNNPDMVVNFIDRSSLSSMDLHPQWNVNNVPVLFDGIACEHTHMIPIGNNYEMCEDCHYKPTNGHVHYFTSYIADHFVQCECGQIESFHEDDHNHEVVTSSLGHSIKCQGSTYTLNHSYNYEQAYGYICSYSECRWIDLDHPAVIEASDYGYASQYYFNEITTTVNPSNAPAFTSTRLRTGIIEGYLVMSAKRNNAGTAYHEYHFDYEIDKINYQLALWSANESLVLNSSIRLEILINGSWVVVRTFQSNNMGQSKENLLDYTNTLDTPTTAFRFIVETNMVTNENNRGRVVIGTVEVFKASEVVLLAPVKTSGDARLIYNPNNFSVSVVVYFMDENNQPNELFLVLGAHSTFRVPNYCFTWPTYAIVKFYYQGLEAEVSIWYLE